MTVLHELLTVRRREIVCRARKLTTARAIQQRADRDLDQGVSMLLDQIGNVLRSSVVSAPLMNERAAQQGRDLLRLGFSVSYVVHSYGDVCQAVTELALELDTPVATSDFRIFSRCLDEAMASALAEYEQQRDAENSRNRAEILRLLVRELDSPLSTALAALESLRCGTERLNTGTGVLLGRCLVLLQSLIQRASVEMAQDAHSRNPQEPVRAPRGDT